MDEFLYYNALYDCYKNLFTEKQKTYFEGYYFYNLSFGELALNEGISRNAVYKQVRDVCEKLKDYEEKLHLNQVKQELIALAHSIADKSLQERVTLLSEKLGD